MGWKHLGGPTEAHDTSLTFGLDSPAACYEALMPQEDKYGYASTPPLRMRLTGAASSSVRASSQENRDASSSNSVMMGRQPNTASGTSISVSQDATHSNATNPPPSIAPNQSTAASISSSGTASQESCVVDVVACAAETQSKRASTSSIMLRGGRNQNAPPASRIKPKGARPPSMTTFSFLPTTFTAPVEDPVASPLPIAPPKRLLLIPSQLRAELKTSTSSSAEDSISLLPNATLKRAPHISQKGQPSPRMLDKSLTPIIINFSPPTDSSPLSVPLSADTSSMYSLTPSTPYTKGTQTPRNNSPERTDSPCSTYSTSSMGHMPTALEWDDTGFLAVKHAHDDAGDDTSNKTAQDDFGDGDPLKRQNTTFIQELLRQRRHRAGME